MAKMVGCECELDSVSIFIEIVEAGACIIYENINPLALLYYLQRRGADPGRVRHIGAYKRCRIFSMEPADFFRHRASPTLISAYEDYLCAAPGKLEGCSPSYAGGPARKDTYFSVPVLFYFCCHEGVFCADKK